MSLDVNSNPATATTTLTWYKASETTPFAVAGDECHFVLVQLDPGGWGEGARELYFGDDGYEWPNGTPIDSDDVVAFAIMPNGPVFE